MTKVTPESIKATITKLGRGKQAVLRRPVYAPRMLAWREPTVVDHAEGHLLPRTWASTPCAFGTNTAGTRYR